MPIPDSLLQQIANPPGSENVLRMLQAGMQQRQANQRQGMLDTQWRQSQDDRTAGQQHQNALLNLGGQAAGGDYGGASRGALALGDTGLAKEYMSMETAIKRRALMESLLSGGGNTAGPPQAAGPPMPIPRGPGAGAGPGSEDFTAPGMGQAQQQPQFTPQQRAEAEARLSMGDEKGAMDALYKQQGDGFDDQLSLAKTIRSEPGVARFNQISPYLASMQESLSDPRAIADNDFVYGTALAMSPDGRVTDQDFQAAADAQGWGRELKGQVAKALYSGGALTKETRQAMYELTRRRAEKFRAQAAQEMQYYGEIAKPRGFQLPPLTQLPEYKPQQQEDGAANIPPQAIQELRSNPDAQAIAEFDEVFGAGAAQQVLSGQ